MKIADKYLVMLSRFPACPEILCTSDSSSDALSKAALYRRTMSVDPQLIYVVRKSVQGDRRVPDIQLTLFR